MIRELSRGGRSRQEVADTVSRGTSTVIRHAIGTCSHDPEVVGDPDEPRGDSPNRHDGRMLCTKLQHDVEPEDLGLSPISDPSAAPEGGHR